MFLTSEGSLAWVNTATPLPGEVDKEGKEEKIPEGNDAKTWGVSVFDRSLQSVSSRCDV